MSGEELALDFLAALRGDAPPPSAAATRGPRLGTVHSSYSGTGAARVIFDGESAAGLRAYVALQPVSVGQRVVLLPVGNTFVILGDVAETLRLRLAGLDTDIAALEATDAALDARLDALEADSGWISPSLVNSWAAFGSTYQGPRYRKRDGIVYIQGLVKNGTAGTIFTLPSGYRPAADLQVSVPLASNGVGRIDVRSSGVVFGVNYSATSTSLAIPPFPAD